MSYGILTHVPCNERNFDTHGRELRCVSKAGHLDDQIGHRFEYLNEAEKPQPEPPEPPRGWAQMGPTMGWLT